MKCPTTSIAAVLLLVSQAMPADLDREKEMSRLEGTWETVKAEINGKPTEKLIGQRMTIKEGRWYTDIQKAAGFKDYFRIELIGNEPPQLDLVLESKDGKEVVRLRSIYLLEGNTLKVCLGGQTIGARPKDFSSGYGKSISDYKRVVTK